MNLFKRWFGKSEVKALSDGAITVDMLGAQNNGVITESKAMKIEAFYSCIRDKAETIGQLPLKLYKVTNKSREQLYSGRYKRIFTEQPCSFMTMQGFLEMLVATYERHGAFYAYKVYNDMGDLAELVPFFNQSSVRPGADVNGRVYYTYVTNDGKPIVARAEDLFIVSMFTMDGYTPVSPIVQCATLLGIADAQEESYKDLQTNGITAQMALSMDGFFKDDAAAQRLKDDWTKFRGPNGRKTMPILEHGLKPISLKLTPQESELLGNKEFTVTRICRMTRVSPHRVGLGRADGTKSTVMELDEAYMRDSLNPILVKTEYAINAITPAGYKVEFNRKAFYAGSPHRLVEAVEREVKGGLASINEGRIDLGRETIEGGDVFAIDNNNVTYGLWPNVAELQAQLYGQRNPANDPKE